MKCLVNLRQRRTRKLSNGSNPKETSPTRRKSKRNERPAINAGLPRAKEKKRTKRMAAGCESVVSGANVAAAVVRN